MGFAVFARLREVAMDKILIFLSHVTRTLLDMERCEDKFNCIIRPGDRLVYDIPSGTVSCPPLLNHLSLELRRAIRLEE